MRQFGGTWSETKLDCVERYLAAYLRVMQKQLQYSLHYVDAFAGRGKQALKIAAGLSAEAVELESFFGDESERADTREFLVGSAIRALAASSKSTRSFDRFVFMDTDESSCEELESIISSDYAQLRHAVSVLCHDANGALDEYVARNNWAKVRAVVFLDPFGLEASWETIGRLAVTGACDVWYLFPLGGVMRMMTNNGQVPDAWRRRLDRVFGTPDWYDEFYRPSGQQSLLEDGQGGVLKDASTQHVVDYIRQRLQSVFPAVSNAGILRNGKSAPLFALVLGVSSRSHAAQRAALNIANHLVKDLGQ
jgi:three-Cys-motif partner protein